MKYYGIFDKDGNIKGHICDDVYYTSPIPKDAIEMTQDEWKLSIDGLIVRDILNKKWIKKPDPTKLEKLNNKKIEKKHSINFQRKEKIESGVEFDNNFYESNEQSIKNLNEILMSISFGIELPKDYTWRTKDNKNIPMDKEKLTSLYQTMINHKNNCYKKSWELKENIDKCETVEKIDKIQW